MAKLFTNDGALWYFNKKNVIRKMDSRILIIGLVVDDKQRQVE
jgi:hypothetical protein